MTAPHQFAMRLHAAILSHVSVLLACGGPAMQRAVYMSEQRGYWSWALRCALEKHGVALRCAGPEALADAAMLHRHSVVLVARQPPGVWTEALVERLRSLPGGAIIEGPVPAVVAERLGVRDRGAGETEGALQVIDPALRDAAVVHRSAAGGTFGMGTSRPVDLEPEQQWPATAAPLTEQQAAAWRACGWDTRRWSLEDPGARVLADWIGAGLGRERYPGIVQRDGLVGCCTGLFAFLGQSHTVAPYTGGEHRNWPRTDAAEALLLGLIDLLHGRARTASVRVLPWPEGYSWSMHVRHDVDRSLKSGDAAAIVSRHRAAGTRATWYWRSRHLALKDGRAVGGHDGNRALEAVAGSDGQEVALHTEALWDGAERERQTVEAVLGAHVRGSSAHGDPTCFRYQGAPNVIWAEQQGLAYTELISHAHARPHRAALLGADGEITLTTTLCLPHHSSLDRTMTSGDALPDEVAAEAARLQRAGGLLQILNHPDINVEELFALVPLLPADGRWDATAAEAIDWWASTHGDGALGIEHRSDGALVVQTAAAVRGAQLEIRAPDGTLSVRTVSLPAGGRSVLT
jgi:hypothetical protein